MGGSPDFITGSWILLQSLLTCSAEIQHAHRDLSSLTVVKRLMSIFSSIALEVYQVQLIPKNLLYRLTPACLLLCSVRLIHTVFPPLLFIRASWPGASWTSDYSKCDYFMCFAYVVQWLQNIQTKFGFEMLWSTSESTISASEHLFP